MYQKILVPVDGSPTSNRGLQEAVRLATLTKGQLRLVHVLDELSYANGFETGYVYMADVIPFMQENGRRILEESKAIATAGGVQADTVLYETLSGRLADRIAEQVAAWHADLVVLGTHGRRGVGRLVLGSDAEQVVRSSTVPVLLVRAPEAEGGAGA